LKHLDPICILYSFYFTSSIELAIDFLSFDVVHLILNLLLLLLLDVLDDPINRVSKLSLLAHQRTDLVFNLINALLVRLLL